MYMKASQPHFLTGMKIQFTGLKKLSRNLNWYPILFIFLFIKIQTQKYSIDLTFVLIIKQGSKLVKVTEKDQFRDKHHIFTAKQDIYD